MPRQFHLQLSDQHGVLHHPRVAGDWRCSVHDSSGQADAAGGARILPPRGGALPLDYPAIRVDNNFRVTTTNRSDAIHDYKARKIVLATGYYDLANEMGVPGEDLDKVFHYYREPHPYFDSDVVVIGGKNSAAEAALDLWRHGARVTLVHRGPQMHQHVKYWVRPDIENRIKAGQITAHFNSSVSEINDDCVVLRTPAGPIRLKNDFVFALTGYHPDYDFLRSVGVELSPEQLRPVCDPESLESNIPGVYVAGVIVAGSRTSEVFIENGRFHGKLIAANLGEKLGGSNPNFPLDAT
jgi:thioredoxin reductase (NADPH)